MQANSIKVAYKNDLRRLKSPASYEQLLDTVLSLFAGKLPKKFKFHYFDSDNDIISLTSEDDYQEALALASSTNKMLKLYISENSETLRETLASIPMPENEAKKLKQIKKNKQEIAESEGLKSMFPENMEKSLIEEFDMVGGEQKREENPLQEKTEKVDSVPVVNEKKEQVLPIQFERVEKVEEVKEELSVHSVNPVPSDLFDFELAGDRSPDQKLEKIVPEESINSGTQTLEVQHESIGTDAAKVVDLKNTESNTDRNETDEKEINASVMTHETGNQFEKIEMKDIALGREDAFSVSDQAIQMNEPELLEPAEQKEEVKAEECIEEIPRENKQERWAKKVQKMIRDEIEKNLLSVMRRTLDKHSRGYVPSGVNAVHNGVRCDGCNAVPIQGIRYKCSTCHDFDFCERCEAEVEHPHPFIKLKDPKLKISQIVTIVNESSANPVEESNENDIPTDKVDQFLTDCKKNFQQNCNNNYVAKTVSEPPKFKCPWGARTNQEFIKKQEEASNLNSSSLNASNLNASISSNKERLPLLARFIKESHGDAINLYPGATLVKTWTFRNDGPDWPLTVKFITAGGDDLGGTEVQVPALKSGEEYDVSQILRAPEAVGRYTQYFRMFDGYKRFGHRVWADILVVEAPKKDEPKIEEVPEVQAPKKEVPKESFFEPINQDKVEEVKQEEPERSESSLFQKPQEQVQQEKPVVAEVEDYNLKAALDSMEEMGFTNRDMNKMLIAKYKDVTEVITRILNNDLSSSAFNA